MLEYANYYYNMLYMWWKRKTCKHLKEFVPTPEGFMCPSCGKMFEECKI